MPGYQIDLMPESRLRDIKGVKHHPFLGDVVPAYCINCGVDGPYLPVTASFVSWLCNKCAEVHGAAFAGCIEPDAVFFEKVKQEQLERYGRELTAEEVLEALKDEHHPLSLLAKERPTAKYLTR